MDDLRRCFSVMVSGGYDGIGKRMILLLVNLGEFRALALLRDFTELFASSFTKFAKFVNSRSLFTYGQGIQRICTFSY